MLVIMLFGGVVMCVLNAILLMEIMDMAELALPCDKDLANIEALLDINEQKIKDLIIDVEAYVKEHYDGKEEEKLPLE